MRYARQVGRFHGGEMEEIPIRNIVAISDLHCGCQVGLCPPVVHLDEGGEYHASDHQKVVWGWWEEFWNEWVPHVCHNEPYVVITNGDVCDGTHHGSVTQITHNIKDQKNIAIEVLRPVVKKAAAYYHIRGTEAHVGQSAQIEEEVAKALGAKPNDIGQHARYELWYRLGEQYLIHFAHHIGTAGSMHYESTALMRELTEAYVEAGRWNEEAPDVVVRSHRHRNAEVRVQTHKGFATVCTTAGWQLKTPFVYKIAGARLASPQIGGTVIRSGDEDVYTRHRIWDLKRPKEESDNWTSP